MPFSKLLILVILFAVISSPMTYRATRGIFGPWVASAAGCATQSGIILHAAVFLGALWLMTGERMAESFELPKGDATTGGRAGVIVPRPQLLTRFRRRNVLGNRVQALEWIKGTSMDWERESAFTGIADDLRAWVQRVTKTKESIDIAKMVYFKDTHQRGGFNFVYARFESSTPGLRGDALYHMPIKCVPGGGCTTGTMQVALVFGDPELLHFQDLTGGTIGGWGRLDSDTPSWGFGDKIIESLGKPRRAS